MFICKKSKKLKTIQLHLDWSIAFEIKVHVLSVSNDVFIHIKNMSVELNEKVYCPQILYKKFLNRLFWVNDKGTQRRLDRMQKAVVAMYDSEEVKEARKIFKNWVETSFKWQPFDHLRLHSLLLVQLFYLVP